MKTPDESHQHPAPANTPPAPAGATHACHASHGTHAAAVAAAAPASRDVIYTCPMHPEVRQIGPGNCPKCGMALEPLMPHAETDDSEVKAVRRKFWIAFALALPVVMFGMAPHLFDL